MNVKDLTTQHLINRKAYFERYLETKPDMVFGGISDVGGDWVDQENRHNDQIEEMILEHIKEIEEELIKRKDK